MYGFAAESAVSPDDIWGLMNAGVSGSGDVLTRWDGSGRRPRNRHRCRDGFAAGPGPWGSRAGGE